MMSMKDIKNDKENSTMQKESRSTGTPSSDTQSNLNNEELNELKRQNKLIVNYLEEIQAELRQEIRQVQDENKEMLREVRASHEHYQKRQKQLFTGIGSMLLVFMLFALIMTIGSDFMSFLHVDILQKAIASKIKASEGFMTFVWYIAYGLPYIFAIGLFISLYEWIRARFHD